MKTQFKMLILLISCVFHCCTYDVEKQCPKCSEDRTIVKDLSTMAFDTLRAIKFIQKINFLKKTNINKKIYETVQIDGTPIQLGKKRTNFIDIGFVGNFNNDIVKIHINNQEMLPVILNSRPNEMDFYDGYLSYQLSTKIAKLTIQINNQYPILLQCDSLHYAYEIFLINDSLKINSVEKLRTYF